jgi:metallo-beta-lactamase class B
MRTAALLLLCATTALAQKDPVSRSWNQPVEPFRIIRNVFYVGAAEVSSYLIATPKGLIVIDGGFEETAPMVLANIEKLGFHRADIRILLNSHAHYDHAGGLAAIKNITGATFIASEGDAPQLSRGGKDDPQFGDAFPFPPITPDKLARDGDRVALGGTILTAHVTAGHTRGCTTWTTTVREGGRNFNVVFVGSPSVPPQYKLVGNPRYPDAVDDYRRQFVTLKSLPCDVFLAAHGSFFDLAGKMKRVGAKPNPFIDPAGYKKFVAEAEAAFEERVKKETSKE